MTKFNLNPGRDLPPKQPQMSLSLPATSPGRLCAMLAAEAVPVPEPLTCAVIRMASAWLLTSTLQERKN
ncbi:MAG: hypothetical protein AB7C90_02550 [Bacteroidales bacterium]